jgi:hypothetical protein
VLGENLLLDLQGVGFGCGHAVADQRPRGADVERVAARLLDCEIDNPKHAAAVVLFSEIAGDQFIECLDSPGDDRVKQIGLKRRDPKPAYAFIDGADGGRGVFGFDQTGQDSPLHAAASGPLFHGSGEIVAVEGLAGF